MFLAIMSNRARFCPNNNYILGTMMSRKTVQLGWLPSVDPLLDSVAIALTLSAQEFPVPQPAKSGAIAKPATLFRQSIFINLPGQFLNDCAYGYGVLKTDRFREMCVAFGTGE